MVLYTCSGTGGFRKDGVSSKRSVRRGAGACMPNRAACNRFRADFNGLFGSLLCLSHTDTCTTESGEVVELAAGTTATAFERDVNLNGESDDLIATESWNNRLIG